MAKLAETSPLHLGLLGLAAFAVYSGFSLAFARMAERASNRCVECRRDPSTEGCQHSECLTCEQKRNPPCPQVRAWFMPSVLATSEALTPRSRAPFAGRTFPTHPVPAWRDAATAISPPRRGLAPIQSFQTLPLC